jgi:Uma2 family endonuclease
VPEYWIVDCGAEAVEVHRSREVDRYPDVVRVTDGAAVVSPQAFPDVRLTLAEIFA